MVDVAGRRRSPATLPGYHAGRPPCNQGVRYPADPPRVEEIIAIMRQAGPSPHGDRLRGLIVVLWRAGLRIAEALALGEPDLDERRGALLIGSGKGGKRREVGMDDWGWEQLRPWLARRSSLPVGRLFCIIDGPTAGGRGRPVQCAPSYAALPSKRACDAASRHTSSATHTLSSWRVGRPAQRDPTPARSHRSRRDLGLPARHRQRRDHQHDQLASRPDDARQRRTTALTAHARRMSRAPPPRAWESGRRAGAGASFQI